MERILKVPGRKVLYILTFLVIFFMALTVFYQAGDYLLNPEKILQGVTISGNDFSAMDRNEAVLTLANLQRQIDNEEILLQYSNRTRKVTFNNLDFKINIEKTVDKALSVGRQGSFWQRWQERRELRNMGYKVNPIVSVNEDKLKELIDNLTGPLQVNEEDATFTIAGNDKVEIKPEVTGQKVDLKDAQIQLTKMIEQGVAHNVQLKLEEIKPSVTTKNLKSMGIDGLLSSYTTYFDTKEANRVYNINVAADAMDDLIVKPGQVISYNTVLGPRNAESGFKEAKVIVNDEVVDGIGGGICQVSTTLYNSILLANLEIVERTNHSIPVGYVPLGRDATVDFGNNIDFKFKNNTEKYLLIKSKVQGNALTFKIYGNSSLRKEVEIETMLEKVFEPKVVYEDDKGLEEGKEVIKEDGKKGFQVRTFRILKAGSKEINRKELPLSLYNPQNRVIAVGKKTFSNTLFPMPLPN